jgi:pimeloyl-ACP methyl ester carboxylesterase
MKKIVKILLYLFAAIMLIFSIAGIVSRDMTKIPEDFEGKYLEISGIKIRYFQLGKGQDILFIHGVPGSLEDWEPIISSLSSNYRVTVYDRPGHGYSSAERIGYNLKHNANIALGLINELHLENVIVVGHSYGGSVIMALAVRNPHQIKAFIPIAGATYPIENIEPIYSLIRIPIIGRGFAAVASSFIGPAMIKDGLREAFRPNEDIIPEGFIDTRVKIWLQTKVLVSTAREELNLNSDLEKIIPDYGNISKRFFIIHGDYDLWVPKGDSTKLHKIIRNSKLLILSNTGHQVQYERSGILIKTINEVASN